MTIVSVLPPHFSGSFKFPQQSCNLSSGEVNGWCSCQVKTFIVKSPFQTSGTISGAHLLGFQARAVRFIKVRFGNNFVVGTEEQHQKYLLRGSRSQMASMISALGIPLPGCCLLPDARAFNNFDRLQNLRRRF